jgi:threonine/homoserine/homoserine lactone efflux protein
MLEALWSGIAAGYGIAVPVGAIAVLIVNVSLRGGFRLGAAAGAGAASADLVYAMVAAFAGSAVAGALEGNERPITLVSAAVLVAIAVHGLWSLRGRGGGDEGRDGGASPAATYFAFLGLTVVNPLTVIYFASLIVGLGLGDDWSWATGAVFAAGAFGASLSWQWLLAGIGAFGRHRLGERFRITAVVGGNAVVLGFAVLVVMRGF